MLFWCLPTFALAITTVAEVATPFYTSLPFHRRLIFDEKSWMTVVAFLPIPTIVAAVKAISLRLLLQTNGSSGDPLFAWGAVLAAAGLNGSLLPYHCRHLAMSAKGFECNRLISSVDLGQY